MTDSANQRCALSCTLRAELDRFWGKALLAYKAAVEHPTKEDE